MINKQELFILFGNALLEAAESMTAKPAAVAETTKKRGGKSPPTTTLKEVKDELLALNESKGRQAVIDALARFGVTKIGDLSPDNFLDCIKYAQALAAGEADEADADADDLFGEDAEEEGEEEEEEEEEEAPPPKRRRSRRK